MSVVDDRIVNMQFNNKDFHTNATQSKKDLESLESTIGKMGKSKGMDQLGQSVEKTTKQFSIMQIAGVTAIATIANKAVNAGINLVKSLSIDPIMDGWNEYQLNLKSVQTIMGNTGRGIKEVEKYLDRMNKFADLTVYNFAEMARNVGTFTAAGVKLQPATKAIKGIASVAALAGTNATDAARAMYQISQAMASGTVSLMDWKSVENAGMGGRKLQDTLIQTAIAMGEVKASAVSSGEQLKIYGKSFRDSIKSGGDTPTWLNAKVLEEGFALMGGRISRTKLEMKFRKQLDEDGKRAFTEEQVQEKVRESIRKKRRQLEARDINFTDKAWKDMRKRADASFKAATEIKTFKDMVGTIREGVGSAWADFFKIMVGNKDEATKLWTSAFNAISQPIDMLADKFKFALTVWRDGMGRESAIAGFKNIFTTISTLIGSISGAFGDIFGSGGPRAFGETLVRISEGFALITSKLVPSEKTAAALRDIFGGVFAVLHIGVSIIKGIATAFGAMFGAVFTGSEKGRGGLLQFLAGIGRVLKAVDHMITSGGKVQDVFSAIGVVVGMILKPIIKMIGIVGQALGALATGDIDGFKTKLSGIGDEFQKLVDLFGKAKDVFKNPFDSVGSAMDSAKSKITGLKDTVSNLSGKGVLDHVKGLAGGDKESKSSTKTGVGGYVDKAKDTVVSKIGGGSSTASAGRDLDVYNVAAEKTKTVTDSVKKSVDNVSKAMKDAGDASKDAGATSKNSVTMMTVVMTHLKNMVELYGKMLSTVLQGIVKGVGAVISWVGGELKAIFSGKDAIDWAALFNAAMVGGILLIIRRIAKFLESFPKLVVNVDKAFQEVAGGITDALGGMQNALNATAIKQIAIAIGILALSIVALALVDPKKAAAGLTFVSALLWQIMAAFKVMSKIEAERDIAVIATAFLSLAFAVGILTVSVLALAFVPWSKLQNGLVAVGALMAMMVASFQALGNMEKEIAVGAAAIIGMAFAINLLTPSVLALAFVPAEKLTTGLLAVAALLLAMTTSLVLLSQYSENVVEGAAAIAALGFAISLLTPVVLAFSKLPAEKILGVVGGISALMLVMTGSIIALAQIGPMSIAAGAAMVLFAFGLNMLLPVIAAFILLDWSTMFGLIGKFALLGVAIVLLGAAAAVAGAPLFVLGSALFLAGAGLMMMATAFSIITVVGAAAFAVLGAGIGSLALLLPFLAQQAAASIVSFIESIAAAAPRVRKALGTIIKAILGTLGDAVDSVAELIGRILDAIVNLIIANVGRVGKAFTAIVREGLRVIRSLFPDVVATGLSMLNSLLKGLGDNAEEISANAVDLVLDLLDGIATAIDNNQKRIEEVARKLVTSLGNAIKSAGKGILKGALSSIAPGPLKGVLAVSARRGGYTKDEIKRQRKDFEQVRINFAQLFMETNFPKELGRKFADLGKYFGLSVQTSVMNAVEDALNIAARGSQDILDALRRRSYKQTEADQYQTYSEELSDAASNMNGKKNKAKQKKLEREANKASKRAERAQRQADIEDARASRLQEIKSIAPDDFAGLRDAYETQSADTAEQARELLAQANAQNAAARRLELLKGKANKKEAKALREQAVALAQQAQALSAEAANATAEARSNYIADLTKRIDDLDKAAQAETAERQWNEKYEKADAATKKEMAQKKADDAATAATAAEDAYGKALQAAKDLRDANNFTAADAKLAEAQAQYELWRKAQDDQKKWNDTVKSDTEAAFESSVNNMLPSLSILEQAAKAVDNYSETQQRAMEQAMAGGGGDTYEYTQNNYSPESLDASTIYRNGRNLVSLEKTKKGIS